MRSKCSNMTMIRVLTIVMTMIDYMMDTLFEHLLDVCVTSHILHTLELCMSCDVKYKGCYASADELSGFEDV